MLSIAAALLVVASIAAVEFAAVVAGTGKALGCGPGGDVAAGGDCTELALLLLEAGVWTGVLFAAAGVALAARVFGPKFAAILLGAD